MFKQTEWTVAFINVNQCYQCKNVVVMGLEGGHRETD